ncbi:MAG: J domain-containing protein [Halobacteriaceae archaeon]
MNETGLVTLLAGTFGAMAGLLLVAAVVVGPVVLAVAIPFAAVAYVLWYHASGRLERRAYRTARRRESRRRARTRAASAGPRGASRPPPPRRERGLSREEAAGVLGVTPDASPEAVRRAYRERVKEVHPDRGGDEDDFERVRDAYERLRE